MEAKSEIIGEILEEPMNAALQWLAEKGAPELVGIDPTLTTEHAEILIKLSALALSSAKDLVDGLRSLSHSLNKTFQPKFAMAGAGGADFDIDIDNHSPISYNKMHGNGVGGAGKVKLPNYKVKLEDFEKFKKQDGSGRYECEKQESPVWKEMKNVRDGYRTNGLTSNDKQIYRWDHRHKDIEVYDHRGRDLGSIDPVSAKPYRVGTGKPNPRVKEIL